MVIFLDSFAINLLCISILSLDEIIAILFHLLVEGLKREAPKASRWTTSNDVHRDVLREVVLGLVEALVLWHLDQGARCSEARVALPSRRTLRGARCIVRQAF